MVRNALKLWTDDYLGVTGRGRGAHDDTGSGDMVSNPYWSDWRCPIPGDPRAADEFLVYVLQPLMDALVRCGEFRSWYFEQPTLGAIRLHVDGADPALFLARLTGLVLATLPYAVASVARIQRCRPSAPRRRGAYRTASGQSMPIGRTASYRY
jgi:hypothetical protein